MISMCSWNDYKEDERDSISQSQDEWKAAEIGCTKNNDEVMTRHNNLCSLHI